MKIGKHSDPNGGCVVMLGGMTLGAFAVAALVWKVVPWIL